MSLYFARAMALSLSLPFPIHIFISALLPLSRITQYPAFLRHALNEPCTYRRVARVDVANIIFEFVECIWIIVNKETKGFAEGGERVFGCYDGWGCGRWEGIGKKY